MDKPEALWLADALMETHPYPLDIKQAAAELRKLSAVEAQRDALLEALKKMRNKYGEYACSVCDQADAAIKAVKETK